MARLQSNLPVLTAQYAPSSAKSGDDVAKEAFEKAKEIFSNELTEDNKKRSWVDQHASLDDVTKAVKDAADNYRAKSSGNAASKWLGRLASRIQMYGVVLDVLVQHHPEYVSLAWGAFKFLFTAIINYETLAKELSKALTRIAEILPQAESDLKLYPTEIMKTAVARLYACLLQIAVKAVRWFRSKRMSHAVGAIWRPWALEFQSEVNEVQAAFANVTSQANLAARAELRDIHVAIKLARDEAVTNEQRAEARAAAAEQRTQLAESTLLLIMEQIKRGGEELKDWLQTQQGMQQQIQLDLRNQKQAIQTIAITQLSGLSFAKGFPSPGACLQYCLAFRAPSRLRNPLVPPDLDVLKGWSQASASSICAIKTNSPPYVYERTILVAITQVIRDSNFNIIWALRFSGHEDTSITTVTILRMLVLQIIHMNQAVATSGLFALTARVFEEAVDERDWLRIFGKALSGLAHVFVVLDPILLRNGTGNDRRAASIFIEDMLSCAQNTVLKIFVPASSVALPSNTAENTGAWIPLKIDGVGRTRARRLRQSEALRNSRSRR